MEFSVKIPSCPKLCVLVQNPQVEPVLPVHMSELG